MIDFVKKNPRILRKWQSLAHSVGMSDRVEVIKVKNIRIFRSACIEVLSFYGYCFGIEGISYRY